MGSMWPIKYVSILVLIFIMLGDEYALYLIPLVNGTAGNSALPNPNFLMTGELQFRITFPDFTDKIDSLGQCCSGI